MTTENSAAKIAELAVLASGTPSTVAMSGGREFILHPPGYIAKEVPQLAQDVAPPRMQWTKQTVSLQNEMSLTAYLNRFKNPDSVIFADITRDTIVGMIDYHHEADPDAKFDVKADLVQHRAVLTLPRSIEWQTWIKNDEEEMSQLDFVSFLEDNAPDVVDPDGAGLLELVRDLEGTRNVKWGSTIRAGSVDNMEFTKESGAQTKGKVALPLQIGLSIPVYFGDDNVEIRAMLRRRIGSEGQLTLWYKLLRPENVRQNRFQEIVQRIETDTDHLTTVYGTAS
jgi:uncharacterized protein YfdQ (DUF2303 family)